MSHENRFVDQSIVEVSLIELKEELEYIVIGMKSILLLYNKDLGKLRDFTMYLYGNGRNVKSRDSFTVIVSNKNILLGCFQLRFSYGNRILY